MSHSISILRNIPIEKIDEVSEFYKTDYYQKNSKRLIKIGFSISDVNDALYEFRSNNDAYSIDDAVNLIMNKSSNKIKENKALTMKHKLKSSSFYEKESSFILDKEQNKSFHINMGKFRLNEFETNEEILNTNENFIENVFICEVCMEEKNIDSEKTTFECGHYFCNDCVKVYYQVSVNEGNTYLLKCLDKNCPFRPSEQFIEMFLTPNEIEKINKLNFIYSVLNDKSKRFCPYPDCNSFGISKTSCIEKICDNSQTKNDTFKKDKKGILEKNQEDIAESKTLHTKNESHLLICGHGHKFCSNCQCLWHEDRDCEFQQEKEFLDYIEKYRKEIKNCPKCGIWTEKLIGCNHIKCSACRSEWCWLCLGEFHPNHYNQENSKCYGRMYEGQITELMNNPNNLIFDNFVVQLNLPRELFQLNPSTRTTYKLGIFKIFKFKIARYESFLKRVFFSFFIYLMMISFNFPSYIASFNILKKSRVLNSVDDDKLRIIYKILISFILFFYSVYTFFLGIILTNTLYLFSILVYIFRIN